MGVDRPLVRLERDTVDRVEQLRTREDPTRLAGHRRQELELGGGQVHRPAPDLHPHPRQVQAQVAGAQHLGASLGELAAQHRPHAGDQLAGAERLGHVVVRAELKPDQLVGFVVAGGEHDDRHARVAPQSVGHLEAIQAWEAKIEDHQVGVIRPRPHQRLRPVASASHRKSSAFQVVAHQLRDLGLVVDDQDRLHRSAW